MRDLPACIPRRFAPFFEEYDQFHVVQQRVMNDLVNTDQNVVISAPTGCGKTAMMELAMVRTLNKLGGKKPAVVYLGPLKALAGEKLAAWHQKANRCRVSVASLTGDTEIRNEMNVLSSNDLLCSTPEKFDWLCRKYSTLMANVQLILVDEVHGIDERQRGPGLEALLTRLKFHRTANGLPPIRFVAVSATIANVEDLAKWLNPCKPYFFGYEYRPVPLERQIMFVPNDETSPFSFDRLLSKEISSVIRRFANNRPTLVFCMCRSSTEESAEVLARTLPPVSDTQIREALQNVDNDKLKTLLQKGVAFHNAGLTTRDRNLIEKLFRMGKIKALFSTTTLAAGVNLPAHLVIIKGTEFCTGHNGRPERLDGNVFLQMIGRAGRPGYDALGRAVILTKNLEMKSFFEKLFTGNPLESGLMGRIAETLVTEVAEGSVRSVSSSIGWFRQTFLYVRLRQNPSFYMEHRQKLLEESGDLELSGSSSEFQCSAVNESQMLNLSADDVETELSVAPTINDVDELLKISVEEAIEQLTQYNLLQFRPSAHPELVCTKFGRSMSRHCVAFKTMKMLMDTISNELLNLQEIFHVLAHSQEVATGVLRTEEAELVKHYIHFAEKSCFHLKETMNPREVKVLVFMPVILAGENITHTGLAEDVKRLFRVALRLANCLLDLVEQADTKYLKTLHAICLFSKVINAKLWHDTPYVSRQLDGIGIVRSRKLVDAGFVTFRQIVTAPHAEIEKICERHFPFGRDVTFAANRIPQYILTLEQTSKDRNGKVDVRLKLSIKNASLVTNDLAPLKLSHKIGVFVGVNDTNTALGFWRLTDAQLLNGYWTRTVAVTAPASLIIAHVISLEACGVDVEAQLVPTFELTQENVPTSTPVKKFSFVQRKREFDEFNDDDDSTMAHVAKCPNVSVGLTFDTEPSTPPPSQSSASTLKLQFSQESAFDDEDDDSVLAKLPPGL